MATAVLKRRAVSFGLRQGVMLLGLVALAAAAHAAVIAGKVTADGKPLAGAWVQLNTGVIIATDARGRYGLPPVPAGTYALQVFAAGKQPVVRGGVVPGKDEIAFDLKPMAAPLGLVHIKAVRADRAEPLPVRIVTRWRPAAEAQFGAPEALELVSTLDGNGHPLIPDDTVRPYITPFAPCLWTQGEAVLALPPGQAELTCSSGPLVAAIQQVVDVKPGAVTEAAASMTLGIDLGALGWLAGDGLCRVSGSGQSRYLVNIALAAAICRAEGMRWVCFVPEFGNDPAQGDPAKAVEGVSGDTFVAGLVSEIAVGGRAVVLGPADVPLPKGGAPQHYLASALKRGAVVYADALSAASGDSSGGLAWELPLDVIADPLSVPALHIHLLGPDSADYLRLWTLLLDHGRHVGPLAFSDGCVDAGRLPVATRTFVRAETGRGLVGVLDGIRQGATLATTGPVVSLAIGDVLPGQTAPADDQTRMAEIDAWQGCVPGGGIARVDLIRGGQVVKTWTSPQVGLNHLQARIVIQERETTWFAVQAYGVVASGSAPTLVACTAPVYFLKKGDSPPGALAVTISGRACEAAGGAPVAGARVTATPATGRPVSTTTSADGTYTLVAPAGSMVEISHPRFARVETPVTGDARARARDTVKFIAWDCPAVHDALRGASRNDLLSWELYQRIEALVASARLDFALVPR